MKPGWLITATLAVALHSPSALAGTVRLLPSELEMPDRIGPLAYTGEPGSWPDPRLGKSYGYIASGVRLDIYVYDAGLKDIPDGAVSRLACEQFEQAKLDVAHGGYKDVVEKREQMARMGATQDPPLAREAVFEAAMNDVPSISYLWVTGAAGNFIKVRFTVNARLRYEVEDARRAVLNAVGDAIRPHLAPPTPPRDEKRKDFAFVMNPDAVSEMGFGLLYLTAVAMQADKRPEALPPCGGEVQPDYGQELAAYQFASRLSDDAAGRSKFARQVVEISKAGFLAEFVWEHRHQDFWGDTVPEDLDLAGFGKWSRKHLKRLKVPRFGYVEFTDTRPLTIEPLE